MAKVLCVNDGCVSSSLYYNYTEKVQKQGATFHKKKWDKVGHDDNNNNKRVMYILIPIQAKKDAKWPQREQVATMRKAFRRFFGAKRGDALSADQGCRNAVEGFEKCGTGTAQIDAETTTIIISAKGGAVVERHMGTMDKTVTHVFVV